MIPLVKYLRLVQSTETESRMVVARGPGERGMWSYYLVGTVSIVQDKKKRFHNNTTKLYILKMVKRKVCYLLLKLETTFFLNVAIRKFKVTEMTMEIYKVCLQF